MLAIARTLMTGPEFLVLDEPTEALALLLVREVARPDRALVDAVGPGRGRADQAALSRPLIEAYRSGP